MTTTPPKTPSGVGHFDSPTWRSASQDGQILFIQQSVQQTCQAVKEASGGEDVGAGREEPGIGDGKGRVGEGKKTAVDKGEDLS